jgi:DNA mismatch repair ATPase MutS
MGASPASFGINVAKTTGIPAPIIQKAQEKADQFEKELGIQAFTDITI